MPIKFNGGAWLSSRPSVDADASAGPDTRDWGPSNWWYAALCRTARVLSLLVCLCCNALQAKPAATLRSYACGWRLGGAGPFKADGVRTSTSLTLPPLLQDVMFDYFLRMMPLLNARSAVLLPPSNASATGIWQTETATVFGTYAQVALPCRHAASARQLFFRPTMHIRSTMAPAAPFLLALLRSLPG